MWRTSAFMNCCSWKRKIPEKSTLRKCLAGRIGFIYSEKCPLNYHHHYTKYVALRHHNDTQCCGTSSPRHTVLHCRLGPNKFLCKCVKCAFASKPKIDPAPSLLGIYHHYSLRHRYSVYTITTHCAIATRYIPSLLDIYHRYSIYTIATRYIPSLLGIYHRYSVYTIATRYIPSLLGIYHPYSVYTIATHCATATRYSAFAADRCVS